MFPFSIGAGPGQIGLRRRDAGHPPAGGRAPQPAAKRRDAGTTRLAGALAVGMIASFNLFHRLADPPRPVWDESYYLTAIARYELGYASFASHPPLGLMLMTAGDEIAGLNRGTDWVGLARNKRVSDDQLPPGFSFTGVRCASALFGVVAALLVFLVAAELAGGTANGLVACAPFLFDTAFVAQFRAAQLDGFQLCFAAAALWGLVRARARSTPARWLAFGIAAGLAATVRANGVLLLAGLALPCWQLSDRRKQGRTAAVRAIAAALVGTALVVAAVGAAHLMVAHRPMPADWPAARADAPFVGPAYRDALTGVAPPGPRAAVAAMNGYRRFMAADLAGVGHADPNGSPPWAWPLGRRPITYRWDATGDTTAYVALVPNPAAWAVSLLGLLGGVAALMSPRGWRRNVDHTIVATLLAIWALFMVADLVLDRLRTVYLYHYFVPLLVGWLLAAALLRQVGDDARGRAITAALTVLILAGFARSAPLALHQPLTAAGCRWRTVLAGAALCRPDVR